LAADRRQPRTARPPSPPADPYSLALRWLGLRELSTFQIRRRLRDREVPAGRVEEIVDRLTRDGALDDLRTARACARTHALVKRHGPHRVARTLQALGIAADTAAQAIGEVFGGTDEEELLTRSLDRRLGHGRRSIRDRNEHRRLYAYLLRQGFSSPAIAALLRARSRPEARGEDES
jgi:SOS response regulatory protein OraA/RecX